MMRAKNAGPSLNFDVFEKLRLMHAKLAKQFHFQDRFDVPSDVARIFVRGGKTMVRAGAKLSAWFKCVCSGLNACKACEKLPF